MLKAHFKRKAHIIKALWNNKVVAQADNKDLINIESNWYFPPNSVDKSFLKPNSGHTTCFWKGEASYYDIDVDGKLNEGGAWYYPKPMEGSISKVGKDFSNYIAFWRGVEITE
jgi:uncharacterized protein (DUF427 family)